MLLSLIIMCVLLADIELNVRGRGLPGSYEIAKTCNMFVGAKFMANFSTYMRIHNKLFTPRHKHV
jgi:hypothetical protein